MKNTRTIPTLALITACTLLAACEQKPAKTTTPETKTSAAAKSAGESAGKAAAEGAKAASETQKAVSEAAKDMPKEE